ncbi:MAG: CPBP family intramembrane metalloprotease [Atopobiaceae bacterium]|jgi:hypothetical protein|nr:CPBP family intramembrane metalloprotease [Atopobiaceae bacterium]
MMGMLFCAIVLRSNSLWPSVVVHALCDVGIVVYALYGDVSAVSYVSQDAATGQAMVVVYVMLMVVGLAYLVPGDPLPPAGPRAEAVRPRRRRDGLERDGRRGGLDAAAPERDGPRSRGSPAQDPAVGRMRRLARAAAPGPHGRTLYLPATSKRDLTPGRHHVPL